MVNYKVIRLAVSRFRCAAGGTSGASTKNRGGRRSPVPSADRFATRSKTGKNHGSAAIGQRGGKIHLQPLRCLHTLGDEDYPQFVVGFGDALY